jgi:hypothetical protein
LKHGPHRWARERLHEQSASQLSLGGATDNQHISSRCGPCSQAQPMSRLACAKHFYSACCAQCSLATVRLSLSVAQQPQWQRPPLTSQILLLGTCKRCSNPSNYLTAIPDNTILVYVALESCRWVQNMYLCCLA